MSRGRPFEPGNQFGRGRPKGSRNKRSLQSQKIFADNEAAILTLAVKSCLKDPQMLRMFASRIVPQRRESFIKIGRLPLATLSDLIEASKIVLQKAAAGDIAPNIAAEFTEMLERRGQLLVTQEFEQRLLALENPKRALQPINLSPEQEKSKETA